MIIAILKKLRNIVFNTLIVTEAIDLPKQKQKHDKTSLRVDVKTREDFRDSLTHTLFSA